MAIVNFTTRGFDQASLGAADNAHASAIFEQLIGDYSNPHAQRVHWREEGNKLYEYHVLDNRFEIVQFGDGSNGRNQGALDNSIDAVKAEVIATPGNFRDVTRRNMNVGHGHNATITVTSMGEVKVTDVRGKWIKGDIYGSVAMPPLPTPPTPNINVTGNPWIDQGLEDATLSWKVGHTANKTVRAFGDRGNYVLVHIDAVGSYSFHIYDGDNAEREAQAADRVDTLRAEMLAEEEAALSRGDTKHLSIRSFKIGKQDYLVEMDGDRNLTFKKVDHKSLKLTKRIDETTYALRVDLKQTGKQSEHKDIKDGKITYRVTVNADGTSDVNVHKVDKGLFGGFLGILTTVLSIAAPIFPVLLIPAAILKFGKGLDDALHGNILGGIAGILSAAAPVVGGSVGNILTNVSMGLNGINELAHGDFLGALTIGTSALGIINNNGGAAFVKASLVNKIAHGLEGVVKTDWSSPSGLVSGLGGIASIGGSIATLAGDSHTANTLNQVGRYVSATGRALAGDWQGALQGAVSTYQDGVQANKSIAAEQAARDAASKQANAIQPSAPGFDAAGTLSSNTSDFTFTGATAGLPSNIAGSPSGSSGPFTTGQDAASFGAGGSEQVRYVLDPSFHISPLSSSQIQEMVSSYDRIQNALNGQIGSTQNTAVDRLPGGRGVLVASTNLTGVLASNTENPIATIGRQAKESFDNLNILRDQLKRLLTIPAVRSSRPEIEALIKQIDKYNNYDMNINNNLDVFNKSTITPNSPDYGKWLAWHDAIVRDVPIFAKWVGELESRVADGLANGASPADAQYLRAQAQTLRNLASTGDVPVQDFSFRIAEVANRSQTSTGSATSGGGSNGAVPSRSTSGQVVSGSSSSRATVPQQGAVGSLNYGDTNFLKRVGFPSNVTRYDLLPGTTQYRDTDGSVHLFVPQYNPGQGPKKQDPASGQFVQDYNAGYDIPISQAQANAAQYGFPASGAEVRALTSKLTDYVSTYSQITDQLSQEIDKSPKTLGLFTPDQINAAKSTLADVRYAITFLGRAKDVIQSGDYVGLDAGARNQLGIDINAVLNSSNPTSIGALFSKAQSQSNAGSSQANSVNGTGWSILAGGAEISRNLGTAAAGTLGAIVTGTPQGAAAGAGGYAFLTNGAARISGAVQGVDVSDAVPNLAVDTIGSATFAVVPGGGNLLQTLGKNGAIGAGFSAANDAANGKPVDLQKAAIAAAGSAIFGTAAEKFVPPLLNRLPSGVTVTPHLTTEPLKTAAPYDGVTIETTAVRIPNEPTGVNPRPVTEPGNVGSPGSTGLNGIVKSDQSGRPGTSGTSIEATGADTNTALRINQSSTSTQQTGIATTIPGQGSPLFQPGGTYRFGSQPLPEFSPIQGSNTGNLFSSPLGNDANFQFAEPTGQSLPFPLFGQPSGGIVPGQPIRFPNPATNTIASEGVPLQPPFPISPTSEPLTSTDPVLGGIVYAWNALTERFDLRVGVRGSLGVPTTNMPLGQKQVAIGLSTLPNLAKGFDVFQGAAVTAAETAGDIAKAAWTFANTPLGSETPANFEIFKGASIAATDQLRTDLKAAWNATGQPFVVSQSELGQSIREPNPTTVLFGNVGGASELVRMKIPNLLNQGVSSLNSVRLDSNSNWQPVYVTSQPETAFKLDTSRLEVNYTPPATGTAGTLTVNAPLVLNVSPVTFAPGQKDTFGSTSTGQRYVVNADWPIDTVGANQSLLGVSRSTEYQQSVVIPKGTILPAEFVNVVQNRYNGNNATYTIKLTPAQIAAAGPNATPQQILNTVISAGDLPAANEFNSVLDVSTKAYFSGSGAPGGDPASRVNTNFMRGPSNFMQRVVNNLPFVNNDPLPTYAVPGVPSIVEALTHNAELEIGGVMRDSFNTLGPTVISGLADSVIPGFKLPGFKIFDGFASLSLNGQIVFKARKGADPLPNFADYALPNGNTLPVLVWTNVAIKYDIAQVPYGGKAMLSTWVDEIQPVATPAQAAVLQNFKNTILPAIKDGQAVTPELRQQLRELYATFGQRYDGYFPPHP